MSGSPPGPSPLSCDTCPLSGHGGYHKNLQQTGSPPERPPAAGRITVRLLKAEAGIRLEVGDDGRGMGEAESQNIFSRFYTTRRGRGGTGLGLHIVHNIVTQKLKGAISCTSSPGKDTHFTIEIPSGNASLTFFEGPG